MYWKISQFPELDHLDAEQKAAVLRRVPSGTYAMLVLRAAFAGAVLGGALYEVAEMAVPLFTGLAGATVAIFAAGASAAAVVTYLVELRRIRVTMRDEIAREFAAQRPPFCFGCGYDLRACDARRCPECGRVTGERVAW